MPKDTWLVSREAHCEGQLCLVPKPVPPNRAASTLSPQASSPHHLFGPCFPLLLLLSQCKSPRHESCHGFSFHIPTWGKLPAGWTNHQMQTSAESDLASPAHKHDPQQSLQLTLSKHYEGQLSWMPSHSSSALFGTWGFGSSTPSAWMICANPE